MVENKNPMSLLLNCQKEDIKVLISLRNNRKLVCNVVAFDKHFNCVLKNVVEMGIAKSKNKGVKKREGYEYESNLGIIYLRGDNVISITKLKE